MYSIQEYISIYLEYRLVISYAERGKMKNLKIQFSYQFAVETIVHRVIVLNYTFITYTYTLILITSIFTNKTLSTYTIYTSRYIYSCYKKNETIVRN